MLTIAGHIRNSLRLLTSRFRFQEILLKPMPTPVDSEQLTFEAVAEAPSLEPLGLCGVSSLGAVRPRRRSFPRAHQELRNRGRLVDKQQLADLKDAKRDERNRRLTESERLRIIEQKIASIIRRTGQVPTRTKLSEIVFAALSFPEMPAIAVSKLSSLIESTHQKYYDLAIRGTMWQEIQTKQKDAQTNSENRKFIDGTF